MVDPQPKKLAGALLQLLKARGLSDEAALAVLGHVIAESPAFQGKWASQAPAPSDERRQHLSERLKTSERLRNALRELDYDADEVAKTTRQ